jgi:Ca-activated chloride channel homolog
MISSLLLKRALSVFKFGALPFFLMATCAASGHAQVAPPAISVDVRWVVLRASVRDKSGNLVSGLAQRNFRVDEDGRPQVIRAFHFEDVPVAVGLVLDNSGSMTNKRSAVTAAAVAFARSSNPGDQMFILNFNERLSLGLADAKLFSASVAELEDAILKPAPAGRTALYDAILSAMDHVQRSSSERKVLIVISDGGDNASQHTLDDVLQSIARSDVAIYTIGLFDEVDPDHNPRVLRRIADASGGEAFLPGMSADAVRICERIAKDIRAQYTISYSPSNDKFNGEYRAIKVRVTADNGTKLQARTRSGYIASPAEPAHKEGRR